MKDRIPANPGRVLVTPENGGAAYYATLTRADNPTQEGTPLNKANLLTDATAALFGLGANAVPNDVFSTVRALIARNATDIANGVKIETGSYTGTGTFGSSNPCSLTFGFNPKVVFIYRENYAWGYSTATAMYEQGGANSVGVFFAGCTSFPAWYIKSASSSEGTKMTYSLNGNALTWYLETVGSYPTAGTQFNSASYTYHYIAIG